MSCSRFFCETLSQKNKVESNRGRHQMLTSGMLTHMYTQTYAYILAIHMLKKKVGEIIENKKNRIACFC